MRVLDGFALAPVLSQLNVLLTAERLTLSVIHQPLSGAWRPVR
jgi:hypothetical protein